MKHRMSLLCYCSLFLIAAIGFTELRAQSPFHFVDSANLAGLTVPHFDGGSQEPYLPALMVTGLALFDYDGDGWTDVYLLGECELFPNQKQSTPRLHPCGNTLYRNQGDGNFVDVTDAAGVRSGGFALGVVAADIDNDGDRRAARFGQRNLAEFGGEQRGATGGGRVDGAVEFGDGGGAAFVVEFALAVSALKAYSLEDSGRTPR